MAKIEDDGILEMGTIKITLGNRDLMDALTDHVKKWLMENVPAEIKFRIGWTIQNEFTIMDLRDRK